MQKVLLPVPHQKQRQHSDCLAACAAMLLNYHNIKISYNKLLKLLKVKSFGTPGHHLTYLSSLKGVEVIYKEGTMAELKAHLENNHPCLVLVRTTDLPYWSYSTDHAIVIVGFDEKFVYINDPVFSNVPIKISIIEFELSWLHFNYRYATIIT